MIGSRKRDMSSLFQGVFTIGSATLLSRILGFLRDAVVAMILGAGLYSDAFFMAFRIPNLLRKLFSDGVLSISFIPEFCRCRIAQGETAAFDMARSFFVLMAVAGTLFTLSGMVFTPELIHLIAPGFVSHLEKFQLTVNLTRIMMPYLAVILLMAVCMGILNALGHFAAPAMAPVLFNGVVIVFALCSPPLVETAGVALAWGVTLGAAAQLLLQLPFVFKKGFRFFKKSIAVHPGAVRTLKTMLPAMVGAAAFQINVLVATFMASRLADGGISYLYYADRLVQFPLALFTASVSTVIFPNLAASVAANRQKAAAELFTRGFQLVFLITLPAMAGLMVLRRPIVALLFFQGEFDMTAVQHTSSALFYLSMGMCAVSGTRLFATFYYAFSRVRLPFIAGCVSVGTNILLGGMLTPHMGHNGLALSLSVSAAVNLLILVMGAGKEIFRAQPPGRAVFFLKILIFSGLMYLEVSWVATHLCPRLDEGKIMLLAGVVGAVLSGVLCYAVLFLLWGRREYRSVMGWIPGKS